VPLRPPLFRLAMLVVVVVLLQHQSRCGSNYPQPRV
jgi:hypothetical protein